jgi:hypothetical protein
MFTRPFVTLASPLATTVFVGSAAGGVLLAPSNANRVALTVQPLSDAFRVGPYGSMTASSGLLIASGVIQTLPVHSGAHFALPNGGATAAIAVWESQS